MRVICLVDEVMFRAGNAMNLRAQLAQPHSELRSDEPGRAGDGDHAVVKAVRDGSRYVNRHSVFFGGVGNHCDADGLPHFLEPRINGNSVNGVELARLSRPSIRARLAPAKLINWGCITCCR
jgi:hypothetical protein